MSDDWIVTMTRKQWTEFNRHLFPGDGDEHGAVLRCGIVRTQRGVRLLVRDVILARDGVDYVPGDRGYRKLTAAFVHLNIDACAEEGLTYLAVHCHGGSIKVEFSETDLASHRRGYPALLDIVAGAPVGALVLAEQAAAGDIWESAGDRHAISHLQVVGHPALQLRPHPSIARPADQQYERQVRVFGHDGQERLSRMKVAIVGLGGAGSLINEYLARLGVGELLLIDPDSIEESNLSRVVGARRVEALSWLRSDKAPRWGRAIGNRLARSKVSIAARMAREANRKVRVNALRRSVVDADVAALLRDCDHIFLAADSALARRLVGAVTHQYLVPSTQVGAKVQVGRGGEVLDVFSVVRSLTPGSGCLTCNGLVPAFRLQDEATEERQRARQRYVEDDEVHAPSVITLNAVAAAHAVDDWLTSLLGVVNVSARADTWVEFHWGEEEPRYVSPRTDPDCRICGPRRFAMGDLVGMPTRLAQRRGRASRTRSI